MLIDRSDINPGDFDIEFNYGQIQWESGDANPGSQNGLGGETARAGYSNGSGQFFVELDGSATPGALIDGGSNSLSELTNVNEPGRYILTVRNGEVVDVVPLTNASVTTLRDSVKSFTGFMTNDVNRRLFRNRSGVSSSDGMTGYPTVAGRKVEIFGSYDSHRMTIDPRVISNANGLMASSVPESDLDLTTSSAGLEVSVTERLKFGAAALFSDGSFKHEDATYKGDLEAQGGALYISYYNRRAEDRADFYFDALVSKTSGDVNNIVSEHNSSNYARSTGETEFSSWEAQLNGGVVFKHNLINHGPYAQVKIISGDIDSYTELGGSFNGTVIPSIDYDSTKLQVGYQVTNQFGNLFPQIRVGYEQELSDQETKIATLELPESPESAFIVGAGCTYNAGGGMFAALDYEYRHYDEGAEAHSVGFTLGIKF